MSRLHVTTFVSLARPTRLPWWRSDRPISPPTTARLVAPRMHRASHLAAHDGGMEDLEAHIPPAVQLRAASLGEGGRRWLAGLPALVADLEARWAVRVERSLGGGTAAFVGAARMVDGTPVILKVSVPDPDLGDEIGTLDRARGRGYVRLLAHDTSRDALLLEALGPALDRVNLPPDRQLEVICRLLVTAWMVPPAVSGPMAVPRDKAVGLDRLVRRLWDQLDGPCSPAVLEKALVFARRRAEAFDPARTVLVHGDAAAANVLSVRSARPGAETGFVFVDPDGFRGDPAYDVGVALRDWCPELLASVDPRGLARHYCHVLALNSGVDERSIWEWAFLERVSTGLYVHAMGAVEQSRPFFTTAEALL
jgi:streptomycin 6-kinase